ncbi:MAG TPA: S9 family peptidase [Thermoanaerobaculia bacterium]|nr:S9 family peptidase [Thermoanaerobaculia bacterium]
MKWKLSLIAALGALAMAVSAAAQSPPSVDSVLDSLRAVRSYSAARISPDGTRVAWVETLDEPAASMARHSAIWVSPVAGGRPVRITAASDGRNHREIRPEWSRDGRSLAFLSDAEKERQLQIYVAPAGGGAARQLTHVVGQVEDPAWSPDGRSLAFLFVEGSTQETGALVAYKPDSGLVEEKIEEQRIAVADVAGGRVRQASPADLYVYEYDWSPDGKSFAATAARGSGTDNYWVAKLYTIPADGGATREIWKPSLQLASPRWSADGKAIAVIHGLMSDFGSTGGDIWTVPAAGGAARNLTPGMAGSPNALFCRADGQILFSQQIDGGFGVGSVDPVSGKISTIWNGPETIRLSVTTEGPASAVVRSSFDRAPEVWAGEIGKWRQITHGNDGARRFWGEAKSLHWESDGARVQGWLLFPLAFDPAKRYPMVVSVHGGPAAASGPSWPYRWNAVLPSQGYFLLLPNPRGSYGFGEKFTQANVKDFGHGDLRDILTGVDAALKAAPIDGNRLGMVGWSYGGYMAMWTVTQTDRFKAAVAGAGIVNWQSYYGQNRIDQWMLPYFGKSVYEDPEVYARSSPITYITKVKTPTLVLHGERDSEVPTPQGYEFWHALKTLNVPTQLVIYENEGHGVRRPDHVKDIERRVVGWLDKYLKSN